MSVLIPDLNVFNYIQAGIERIAYNTTCNEFYCYSVVKHFENYDISEEAERLVRCWIDQNEMSYNIRYNESSNKMLSEFYQPTATHKKLTAIQLLKYLECVSYNIEIESFEYTFLKTICTELTTAIVSNMPEYKVAEWSC